MRHRNSEAAARALAGLAGDLLVPGMLLTLVSVIMIANYNDARDRTNVGVVRTRYAAIASGLEAYFVDNAAYPQCNSRGTAIAYGTILTPHVTTGDATIPVLERTTTPIAYLNAEDFNDPFDISFRRSATTALGLTTANPSAVDPSQDVVPALDCFIYQGWGSTGRAQVTGTDSEIVSRQWLLHSAGPDETYFNLGGVLATDKTIDGPIQIIYDPTNGTNSFGSIFKFGGHEDAYIPLYAAGRGLRLATQAAPGGPAEPSDVSSASGWEIIE